MKAIVIDDSRAVRMMLKRMLQQAGFESVIEAAHGGEALEQLQRFGPQDLALVDWNMPQVNGFEFVQRVRAEPHLKAMRLMMVTTETETEQMLLALEAGADEYLMKPFTVEAVVEKLQLMGLR